MKVKEVMTKEVISIKPADNAREALDLLSKMDISGLPVIDEQGRAVGMFTEKEILSYVLPSYIEKVGRFIYEENPKSTKKKIAELKNILVSQLMRRDLATTAEDTTICEVARIMLIHKVRRLVVVDKAGKVLGIVARCDIVRALAREL